MASWEDELAVLLRELGVTLEEPKTHLRPTQISEADHQQGEHPLRDKDTSKRQAQSADNLQLTLDGCSPLQAALPIVR